MRENVLSARPSAIPLAPAKAAKQTGRRQLDPAPRALDAGPLTEDVGVTGLWRLTEQLAPLRRHRIIIAVAGMEGALFTVLAGLVEAPIIAVASSVGYGVAHGGRVARDVALASCAPGVMAVNIDNGFGAATAAIKILRSVGR